MNSKAFKIVSIILIIFGILGCANVLSTLVTGTSYIVGVILNVIFSVLELVAGVLGNKAVKTGEQETASLCFKLGIALVAVCIISAIVGAITASGMTELSTLSGGAIIGASVVGSIISLILPVLYLLGARNLNK